MTAIPLPSARRGGTVPDGRIDWTEARHFARSASGLVNDATGPLFGALVDAIATAAAQGLNDTGARQTADTLRDARIALDTALTRAGRTLADRDVRIRPVY
jgi:hypothetical protein